MIRNVNNYKICRRNDGRYKSAIMYHGKSECFYGYTKAEVRDKLQKRIEELNQIELNNGTDPCISKYMTLTNWAYVCLNTYCIGNVCGRTYLGYKCMVDQHFKELGKMQIGKIKNYDIQRAIIGLSKITDENGLSQNYLLRIRMFLHLVFGYAVKNELIKSNPVAGIRIPKTGTNDNRALTTVEQDRLVDAVKRSEHIVMFSVIVALYTGCRKGEILGLQWKDIDYEKKQIRINNQLATEYIVGVDGSKKSLYHLKETKTKNSRRIIHMIEPLLEDMKEYENKQIIWKEQNNFSHTGEDFVFPSSTNTPLGTATFYRYYHEILREAGLTDINFHTLRHTFATRCLENGVDLITVSRTLGHSSVKVTGDIYSHMTELHQQDSLECLNSIYKKE